MEQLGIHCEHKIPEKDMPIFPSSKYSSSKLIYIPLHCSHPILNLLHLGSCNSLLFCLSFLLLNARQKQAGIKQY